MRFVVSALTKLDRNVVCNSPRIEVTKEARATVEAGRGAGPVSRVVRRARISDEVWQNLLILPVVAMTGAAVEVRAACVAEYAMQEQAELAAS